VEIAHRKGAITNIDHKVTAEYFKVV